MKATVTNDVFDLSRSSYAVDIDYTGENTGYDSLTRNEFVTFTFLVSHCFFFKKKH